MLTSLALVGIGAGLVLCAEAILAAMVLRWLMRARPVVAPRATTTAPEEFAIASHAVVSSAYWPARES